MSLSSETKKDREQTRTAYIFQKSELGFFYSASYRADMPGLLKPTAAGGDTTHTHRTTRTQAQDLPSGFASSQRQALSKGEKQHCPCSSRRPPENLGVARTQIRNRNRGITVTLLPQRWRRRALGERRAERPPGLLSSSLGSTSAALPPAPITTQGLFPHL